MEKGESILDAIFDEDNCDDVQEVEMMDVEEGELVEQDSQTEVRENTGRDVCAVNQESCSKSRRRRNNKKKNRRKKGSSDPKVTDINRFVLDVCKRLQEKKSYLVYTAVGCMGVSALSDLVKEVDAIQACGGQKTADHRRFRNGGGILWNILKTRDPDAFKEIMKKGKEFEKQFRAQNIRQGPVQYKEASPERMDRSSTCRATVSASDGSKIMDRSSPSRATESAADGSQLVPHVQNQPERCNVEGKRVSVHDRIRVPVRYDDLLGEEDQRNESS